MKRGRRRCAKWWRQWPDVMLISRLLLPGPLEPLLDRSLRDLRKGIVGHALDEQQQ